MNFSNFSTTVNETTPICDKSQSWWTHQHNAYVFAYKIVTPMYFILGMIGHVISLLAFYKQAKTMAPYAYQIFVTVNQILEIFAFTCFSISFRWFSGIENEGALWYQRNHFLMWYAAHVSFPALNAFITTGLLLSLCMAADRTFAIGKPFVYRNMKGKKYQHIGLCASVLIGFSTSIFDAFRFHIVADDEDENRYRAVGDPEYMKTFVATFLAHLRDAIRVVGLLALIGCNALIVLLYHSKNKTVAELTNAGESQQSRTNRREAEKTLLLLTVCQSILTAIGMTFLISFYAMIYVDPNFLQCEGLFMAPCLDATLQIATIVDFYFIVAVSKQFRAMIYKSIRGSCGNQPTTFNGTVTTSGQNRAWEG